MSLYTRILKNHISNAVSHLNKSFFKHFYEEKITLQYNICRDMFILSVQSDEFEDIHIYICI